MTAPTFVSVTNTVFNTTTSPKTTASIAVQNGDLIIATRVEENAHSGASITTASGSTSAWTTLQNVPGGVDANIIGVFVAKATATATGNITVSSTGAGNYMYGLTVTVWRNHNGTGATNNANNGTGSGAPSVSLTTTGANSAVLFASGDWTATSGPPVTFTASTGTPVQDLADQTTAGANYCIYASHVTDMGSAGAKTIGMSSPASQRYNAIAVEILGIASSSVAGIDVVPVATWQRPGLGVTAKRVMPQSQPLPTIAVVAPPITGSTLPMMGVG